MRRVAWLWPVVVAALLIAGAPWPQAGNDFRFAIIGDRTGSAAPGVYERVLSDVDRFHPDFAINVGDTIEGGNDASAEREWSQTWAILKPHRFPFYFTPGNHDVWSTVSQRLWERETGRPLSYSFDCQNAHFTVLDNSRSWDLSDEQMAFLSRDLELNQKRDPKFIFFHQPFWLLPLKLQSGQFPLHQLVTKYHVRYVISGHTHQFARMVRDGVVYLVVGSSGGHLRIPAGTDGFAAGWFYQYIAAQVKGAAVELRVHEIGEPFGKGRTFKAEEWGEHGLKLIPGNHEPAPASKE